MAGTAINRWFVLTAGALLLAACSNSDIRMLAPVEHASNHYGETAIAVEDKRQKTALERAADVVKGPDISLSAQRELGDKFAKRTLAQIERSANKPLERKLNEIVLRLAEHIDNNPFIYRVYLVEDERANAYTPGGGHLFVTTGLVSVLKTEAQMAMVLAHEIAHNIRADVVKGERGRAMARGATMFSKRMINKQLGLPWLATSFNFLVRTSLNAYTRDQESEADKLGLKYLVATGYDPYQGAETFRNLMKVHKERPELVNFFFGDHPTNSKRVWQLQNLVKAYYSNINTEWRVRSTTSYDLLASRYWRKTPGASTSRVTLPGPGNMVMGLRSGR